jgi:hypothetical protein
MNSVQDRSTLEKTENPGVESHVGAVDRSKYLNEWLVCSRTQFSVASSASSLALAASASSLALLASLIPTTPKVMPVIAAALVASVAG